MLGFWQNGMAMELIRGIHNLRSRHQGCVATIGNFDGVHLGHKAILQQLSDRAVEKNSPSLVMVFEPQPREFFAPDSAPARLMTFREKCEVLSELGVDRVLCIKFDRHFCSLNASAFCEHVLVKGLGVRHLVVGDDFRFGNDRCGDFAFLQKEGVRSGFSVENTHTYEWQGERVSSTRIRKQLEQNRFDHAAAMLTRPFLMSGRVVHGRKLGRTIGIPTANLLPKRVRTPVTGVFAVEVEIEATTSTGQVTPYQGVANLGVRPTIEGSHPVGLEVHLLDADLDLYGKHIRVLFRHKIRDEKKFDGLEALKAAIQSDIQTAKYYFKT